MFYNFIYINDVVDMLNSQEIYLINYDGNAFNNAHSTLTDISFRLTRLNYVGLINWLADAADIFKAYVYRLQKRASMDRFS